MWVEAKMEWTTMRAAGATVAMTARRPKRSTNPPRIGDMHAEIM